MPRGKCTFQKIKSIFILTGLILYFKCIGMEDMTNKIPAKPTTNKNNMAITFSDYMSGDDHNCLKCPVCDEFYLHQMDAKNVTEIGSLPCRSGGIAIPFWCEFCGGCDNFPFMYLAITHHKGNTYMQWVKNPWS